MDRAYNPATTPMATAWASRPCIAIGDLSLRCRKPRDPRDCYRIGEKAAYTSASRGLPRRRIYDAAPFTTPWGRRRRARIYPPRPVTPLDPLLAQ